MNRPRVMLIYPSYRDVGGLNGYIMMTPLGMLRIASAVSDVAEVKVLDMRVLDDIEKTKKEISNFAPDIVGISASFTTSTYSAVDAANIVKSVSDSFVVVGGIAATYELDYFLENRNIDAVVRGEGEVSFREIVENKGKNLGKIRGLSFKRNRKIFHNRSRGSIKNLDVLPAIDRRLIGKSHPYMFFGTKADSIETTRGCPYACKFCAVTSFYGRLWRKFSMPRVMKEIGSIQERGVSNIFIVDDNFNFDSKRVSEFCDEIIKNYSGLHFLAQCRADPFVRNPKTAEKMAEAGFDCIFVGVESGLKKDLDGISKQLSPEIARKAVKILKDNNIATWTNYILGANLSDTKSDIEKNIEFALEVDTDIANFSVLTPLPGTKLEAENRNRIFEKNLERFDLMTPVMHMNNVSEDYMRKAVDGAYKRYYLRPKKLAQFLLTRNSWMKNIKFCSGVPQTLRSMMQF